MNYNKENENCENYPMRKVVAYCRCASPVESHADIEYQQMMIRIFADSHNWEIVDRFVDEGYSGNSFKRPEFMRMAGMVESNPEWDAILVYKESCLSRDYKKYTCCEEILNKQGIELISVKRRRMQERFRALNIE